MRDLENYKKWRERNKDRLRIKKAEWARSLNGRASQRRYRKKSIRAMRFLYIGSAKKRNIELNITQVQFEKLVKKDCVYCGQTPIDGKNGIDRKDNSIGYLIDNAVPCCFKCNQMKGKLKVDAFIEHIFKILEQAIKKV